MSAFHMEEQIEADRLRNRKILLANKITQISPSLPIQGYIFVTVEDGTERAFPIRTDKAVVDVRFKPTRNSAPWNYEDDPDGDGVFISRRDAFNGISTGSD